VTEAELARITGADLDEMRRWRDLGLLRLDPNGALDSRCPARVRLIQFALGRGMEPERMAAALAEQPDLLDLFEEQIGASAGPGHSLEEAMALAGVDPVLAERVRHAAGLDDQATLHADDVEALRSMSVAIETGMPEEALLQLVRVYADALGRVAEAENRLFHLHVHEQFRAQGLRGPALVSATRGVSEPLLGLVEPTVVYFHRKAWERASLEDLLLHLCEDVTLPGEVRGQMTSTVMFIDLADFTPMTMVMGDAAAAQVVDRFSDLVRSCAAGHGGRIVKQIGDAFMVVFSEAANAIACGLDIEAVVADEPQFPSVHVGAHTGELLYREGDYLGHTVNVAARIASEAGPHEMIVSASLREAAGEPDGVEFVSLGPRRLKGISEPVALFAAHRGQLRAQRLRDPVCGMEIRPGHEHARLVWEGREVAFCSTDCLQRFTANPGAHAIP
jgi:adenylate cyclase